MNFPIMQHAYLPVNMYHIAVELPLQHIYTRLGFRPTRTHLTEHDRARMQPVLQEGQLVCQPAGVYLRKGITARTATRITLDGGLIWESRKITDFLTDAAEIFLLGTTVGRDIVALRDRYLQQGDTYKAVIIDAVASELAESAMQWLHEYAGKLVKKELKTVTKRRYSPGYGDFPLHYQQEIVALLRFAELGVRVNEHHLLIPEKSVTAVIGIL